MALIILREAEDTGPAWAADAANSWLGMVAYWHGDFVEARAYCERALEALAHNKLDPKILERFGDDGSFPARCLAVTMWQLGEVERARALIDLAARSASESGSTFYIADALFWKSYLEVWRGDPSATLKASEALEPLAREHGMVQYVNEAELHSGWARGRMHDPEGGAAQVRRVLAAFVEQGVRINLGLYTGLLAELEAETLGAEGALARIDEAFRLSNQWNMVARSPSCTACAGTSCSSATPRTPLQRSKRFGPQLPSRRSRARAAPVCEPRSPSPSYTNRPRDPPTPTLS